MKNDGGVLGMFIKNRTAHQLCPMVGIFSTGTGALDGQYADSSVSFTKIQFFLNMRSVSSSARRHVTIKLWFLEIMMKTRNMKVNVLFVLWVCGGVDSEEGCRGIDGLSSDDHQLKTIILRCCQSLLPTP